MKKLINLLLFSILVANIVSAQRPIWKTDQANAWYAKQPWLVGCNYTPATAINQLEMWQAETFDLKTIDKEFQMAEKLGFNSLRVFLHHLVWKNDKAGYYNRLDQFLNVCAKHHITPMFVIFDSCWDPFPKAGKQREPVKGLHNSGWVQDPGLEILSDPRKQAILEEYVKDLVKHFANDKRILLWDVWNEPDNNNTPAYVKIEVEDKGNVVAPILAKVFEWARSVNPSQPLTSGIWLGDWSAPDKLTSLQKIQIENSDVISFHNYDHSTEFEKRINWLKQYNRPILCTEYMARGNGSTFQIILPVAKKHKVAAYNWGFVAGKTNTLYPWNSWEKAYDTEPVIWFHEIYRNDGTPYDKYEEGFIRNILLGI